MLYESFKVVLWYPGGPWAILEWFWIDSWSVNFSSFLSKLAAGGKPSTWLPPGGLVEHIKENNQADKQTNKQTNLRGPRQHTFSHPRAKLQELQQNTTRQIKSTNWAPSGKHQQQQSTTRQALSSKHQEQQQITTRQALAKAATEHAPSSKQEEQQHHPASLTSSNGAPTENQEQQQSTTASTKSSNSTSKHQSSTTRQIPGAATEHQQASEQQQPLLLQQLIAKQFSKFPCWRMCCHAWLEAGKGLRRDLESFIFFRAPKYVV